MQLSFSVECDHSAFNFRVKIGKVAATEQYDFETNYGVSNDEKAR